MAINHSPTIIRVSFFAAILLLINACSTDGSNSKNNWLQQTADMMGALGTSGSGLGELSLSDISAGLKEALRVGTSDVVAQLGQQGGFDEDPSVHIPLPENLREIQKKIDPFGLSGYLDDLETRINSAAEVATPKAKALFLNAISEMSIDDAKAIYQGPEDAATQYFRSKMQSPLATKFRPIIQQSLNQVEAVQLFDNFMAKYQAIPFMPDIKGNLTEYTIDKGMDGIFHYLAKEEAAIRANPAKRTTELLRQVFGR